MKVFWKPLLLFVVFVIASISFALTAKGDEISARISPVKAEAVEMGVSTADECTSYYFVYPWLIYFSTTIEFDFIYLRVV
jgi:hypothetical protein